MDGFGCRYFSGFTGNATRDNFGNLMELLCANLSNREFFTHTHNGTVRLADFVAWCAHIGYDIPPELAALAKPAQVEPHTPAVKLEAATDTAQTICNKADNTPFLAKWKLLVNKGTGKLIRLVSWSKNTE